MYSCFSDGKMEKSTPGKEMAGNYWSFILQVAGFLLSGVGWGWIDDRKIVLNVSRIVK